MRKQEIVFDIVKDSGEGHSNISYLWVNSPVTLKYENIHTVNAAYILVFYQRMVKKEKKKKRTNSRFLLFLMNTHVNTLRADGL